MNKSIGAYSLRYESQIESTSSIELDTKYQLPLVTGVSSPIGFSVQGSPFDIKFNSLINKCHFENIRDLIEINNTQFFGRDMDIIFQSSLSTGRTASLFEGFKKLELEKKPKELSITPAESINIARIFVTEGFSLEVLLMLADEGPKSIEELCNDITPKEKTIKILFDLWEYNVISIRSDIVNISARGIEIVSKLRKMSKKG